MADEYTTFDYSVTERNVLIGTQPHTVQQDLVVDASGGAVLSGLILMESTTAGNPLIKWDGTIDGSADPVAVLLDSVTLTAATNMIVNVARNGTFNSQYLNISGTAPTKAQLVYMIKFGLIPSGYTNT